MKIERNGKMLILSGNDLFGMIGIAAIFFFCVGIRLLIACIWPEDGIVDWLGTGLVACWTCLALGMAVRSLNDALTQLVLDETGANVEYMYAFLGGKDTEHAYMIFRVADNAAAAAALASRGIQVVEQEEIDRL